MRRWISVTFVSVLLACGGAAEEARGGTIHEDAPPSATTTRETSTSEPVASRDPRMDAIVTAHTARRAEHCAPPLAWSDALARQAQAWADHLAASGCQLQHSQSPYGENLAAGTEGTLSPEQVVELWYREVSGYRFRTGGFSMSTGHFTQLVWAGSERVGCGVTTCNGLDVWVCNYDPPGNVEGRYRENVLPTSCR